MYISKITLKNWKNFQSVTTPLQLRVFIIGPNASGKSNFLDAFRFLKDVANDGLLKAVQDKRGGISQIRCLAARKDPAISIEVEISDAQKLKYTYHLSIMQDNVKRPKVHKEEVRYNGEVVLKRPSPEDKEDPLRLTQTALEQISANKPFREVADFFKSITYQHLIPQLVRDPADFSPKPIRNDPYGRDFLQRMWETRKDVRQSRLRKIASALKIAIPQLSELFLEMDQTSGIVHLYGRYEHWRPHGAKQNESQFSDGTLRLLGLLWTLFEGTGPLLLEEPEISLHSEVVRRLPSVFARINRLRKQSRQIIISTHSEEIIRDEGIAPEEVLRLEPGANGTEIRSPEEADIRAMKDGRLTAADVLMPKAAPKHPEQLEIVFEQ